MKRIANMAYSAIGGGILLLVGMPPFPANATLPPACVTADEDTGGVFTDIVTVTNGCKRKKRVKAIIDYGPDSSCNSLDPGKSFTHRYPSIGKFKKLVNC
jgi:hypothetical protein